MRILFVGGVLALLASLSLADEPTTIAEPDFSPPPVPDFMLRKPDKPLTLEEMRRQADEAAARVKAVPHESSKPQPVTEGKRQQDATISGDSSQ